MAPNAVLFLLHTISKHLSELLFSLQRNSNCVHQTHLYAANKNACVSYVLHTFAIKRMILRPSNVSFISWASVDKLEGLGCFWGAKECTDGWNTGLVLPVMGRRSIVSPVILKPGYIRIIQRGIFLQCSANLHSQSFLFIWPGVGPEHWHFPRFLWWCAYADRTENH